MELLAFARLTFRLSRFFRPRRRPDLRCDRMEGQEVGSSPDQSWTLLVSIGLEPRRQQHLQSSDRALDVCFFSLPFLSSFWALYLASLISRIYLVFTPMFCFAYLYPRRLCTLAQSLFLPLSRLLVRCAQFVSLDFGV